MTPKSTVLIYIQEDAKFFPNWRVKAWWPKLSCEGGNVVLRRTKRYEPSCSWRIDVMKLQSAEHEEQMSRAAVNLHLLWNDIVSQSQV